VVGRPRAGQCFDFSDLDRSEHSWPSRAWSVLEAVETLTAEAVAPSPCGVLAHPDAAGDLGVRGPVGGSEHNPSSHHIAVWATGGVRAAGQDMSFFGGEDDDVSTGGDHIHF